MKNTMRKMLSLALVVVMLACAIPFSAFAAGTHTVTFFTDTTAAAAVATFTVEDGKALNTQATSVAAPAVEGKHFTGWREWETGAAFSFDAGISEDTRLFPAYDWNVYTVRFLDESGIVLATEQVGHGNKVSTIPVVNKTGYVFDGWSGGNVNAPITANIDFKATFVKEAVPAVLTINIWVNNVGINGTQLSPVTVRFDDINTTPTYNLANAVPSGYTFFKMENGSLSSTYTLSGGENACTIIVKASNSIINGSTGGIISGGNSTTGSTGSTGGTSVSGGSNTSGGIWLGNNNTVVNKDPYPVYLNIYMNGNVSTIAKKVDITKGIAADGYVDLEDVKTVVKSYFNAKDSDGILYDGLYIFDGSFGGQYTTDVGRVDGYGNINEDRKLSTVNINVMIKNAVAKGSVAADTSNPKTGDMAFLTVTALVASAGALALVYANKKRFLVK